MVPDDLAPPQPVDDQVPRALLTEREFVFVCVGAAVLVAAFIVWGALDLGGRDTARIVRDLGQGAAALLTVAVSALRARQDTGRARLAWQLIGVFALAWGFAQVVWSYLDLNGGLDAGLIRLVDIGLLVSMPLATFALLRMVSEGETWTARARLLVDTVVVAGSVFFLGWVLVVSKPLHPRTGSRWSSTPFGVTYWVFEAIVAALVVLFVTSPRARRAPAVFLIPALGLVVASDVAFVALPDGRGAGVRAVVAGGWVLAFLLISVAALKSGSVVDDGAEGSPIIRPITAAIPYSMVVVCTGVLIERSVAGRMIDAAQLWCLAGVYLALVARHHLVVRENHSLTSDLEAKVAQRASELRQNEERLQTMIRNVSDVVMVVRRGDGKMLFTSASSDDVLGYSSEELNGVSIFALVHSQDIPLMEGFLGTAGAGGGRAARIEVRMRHRDGSWRYTETSGADLSEDPVLGGVVLTTRDVTEQKKLEDQLTHQAFHDSLTGLPNRALFGDRIEHALARTQRSGSSLAVLFVDLDDFKSINDSFGHQSGDELLSRVAQLLVESLRPADTVARLGGDEFAILMEDAGAQEALELAERIKTQFAQPLLVIHGSPTPIASSIGIAVTGSDASTSAELMRNADIAMYSAKNEGKARCRVFEASMHSIVLERVALQSDLRHAIERSELELHYQPVIELVTGRPLGFEALVRWNHPERGMIKPLEFICLAEETGLITPIGEWVLAEACRQLIEWDSQGVTSGRFGISVNVSGRQVADTGFVHKIGEILAATAIDPRRLTIELTESTLLEDTEATIAWLKLLKDLGIRLALDDFGTGFSSLSYLRRLPVDCLKVDASFVRSITETGTGGELALAVVNLARTLRLRTVAEGVEHLHQAEFLTRSGCRFAQGYHFSPPLPRGEIPEFVRSATEALSGPNESDLDIGQQPQLLAQGVSS